MILRRDPDHGAAILSIPRDLWVPIAGRGDSWKINAAFNGGADRLIETIQQSLGIPIHHYIEVDFDGFARLVDTVGGVEICVPNAAQDEARRSTSNRAARPRRRRWRSPSSARGTTGVDRRRRGWPTTRTTSGGWSASRTFLRTAATAILDELRSNPLIARRPARGPPASSITVDPGLDVAEAAGSMRAAFQDGLTAFSLPTERAIHGDQDALDLLEDEADTDPRLLPRRRADAARPDDRDARRPDTGGNSEPSTRTRTLECPSV